MSTNKRNRLAGALSLATLGLLACRSETEGPSTGSETHFLMPCDRACWNGTQCICGVCTSPCSDSTACTAIEPASTCSSVSARVAQGRCAPTAPSAFCDVPCSSDRDCSQLGDEHTCLDGYCRIGELTVVLDTDAGADATCQSSGVIPDDLLVLGDSLIEFTSFTAALEQQVVAAGLLQQDQHLRQQASALDSRLAEGTSSIGAQYASAIEKGRPRVVIMDGGETDMFTGLCDAQVASACPNVQGAVAGARSLLEQMGHDGVEHVLYFFYPDPIANPVLKEALDALRPLLRNVCGNSAVPCHWIDLQPLFVGHAEYLATDGMLFSDDGCRIVASAVWNRMRQRCIAQ